MRLSAPGAETDSPSIAALDEILPFEVQTVPETGWAGTGNGALLGLAADSGFDALVAVDRGFAHQQNQDDLPLPVVIMLAATNRPDDLRPLVPGVIAVLSGPLQRRVYHVSPASP